MNAILFITSMSVLLFIAYLIGRHFGYEDGWMSHAEFVNSGRDEE